MALFAGVLALWPIGDSAFRAARWYGHFGKSAKSGEVGAAERWRVFKDSLFATGESFEQSALQIGQTTVENMLLTTYIFNEGSAQFPTFKVKPLHSLYVILTLPIPRVAWENKPVPLGITLPYDSGVLTKEIARTNWGPGIVAHAVHDGGVAVLILYAVLIAAGLRFIDEVMVRHPGNPFLLAFLSAASVQIAAITRGDLATMIPLALLCLIYMAAIVWATRMVVGGDRSWPGLNPSALTPRQAYPWGRWRRAPRNLLRPRFARRTTERPHPRRLNLPTYRAGSMSKSLAISAQLRPTQMVGGVASHFQNVCRGIEQVIHSDDRWRDLRVEVYHGPAGVPYRSPLFGYHQTSHRLGRFAAETRFGLTRARDFDATLFTNYFRPPAVRSARSVAVIHDLLDKHFPDLSTWPRRAWLDWAQRQTLRRCDRVITISQTVRDDVLRHYGPQWASKVTPIWNPIAFERLEGDHSQSFTGGRPYVLAVAVDRPFKNLYTLIRAFDAARHRLPEHCLVLVGELRSRRPKSRIHARHVASSMPSTVDLVRELGLQDRVIVTGFVSDAELGALYRGASLFVMPSLFEGFGMPPIESLALGVPTLVSGIPVLREVTLGAAQYLEHPESVEEMSAAMVDMLEHVDDYRPSTALRADIRRRFAPATIAAQYLAAIFDEPLRTSDNGPTPAPTLAAR